MHSPLFRSGSLLLKTASASLTLGLLTSAAFTRTSSHDRGGKRDNTRLLLLLRRGVHYTFPSLIVHCHARPQSAHTSVVTAGEDHEHNQTRENPAIQQLASGSIVGLFLGLSLRAVSRALVFAVGVSIILFQWLSLHGLRIIPSQWIRDKLRRSPRGLRWMFEENAPFKLSMAGMMTLAAVGRLPADDDE